MAGGAKTKGVKIRMQESLRHTFHEKKRCTMITQMEVSYLMHDRSVFFTIDRNGGRMNPRVRTQVLKTGVR